MANKIVFIIKPFILFFTLLALSGQCFAEDKWKIRLRGIGIIPDDSSTNILLGNTTTQTAGVEIDSAFVPELDITYMITPHIGIEAIAGIANHDVNVDGTPTGALAAVGGADGLKLFDTWVLPPTITLQYHFLPNNNLRPYIGVGANYTATLADNASDELEAAVGGPVKVSSDNSWGWAVQAGFDYDISDNWFFNADVKYIDIDTVANIGVNGGPNAGAVFNVDLDVDPWVVGAGIGFQF